MPILSNQRCASNLLIKLVLLLAPLSITSTAAHAGSVSGSLEKWSPVTIDFNGPTANETDDSPNPFLDYRLNVLFTAPDGSETTVPGFFAGNGSGGARGDIWRVRFSADQVGRWQYRADLRSGSDVAVSTDSGAGSAASVSGAAGEFYIQQQAADAPGFLRHGRLEYTGEHYLKFRDGPYWIKGGTDSPENFLGYKGIDGTVDQGGTNQGPVTSNGSFLHDYAAHVKDAQSDDPFFSNANTGADSRGITGALNYLSSVGVNSIYFLPMNLGGDGQETYPFVGGKNTSFNKTHYDISKLYQWHQVLSHAQRRGIALNIQLSETEPANEKWLDNGKLGVERKLFFRELIARFGYVLAAKWNLGEENDYPVSELIAQADYLNKLDWTKKPIAVHTQINNFRDYEKLVGNNLFSASSIQYDPPKADGFVEDWRKRSKNAGRAWVIDMDENTGGVSNKNAATRRKQILYDVYFSGGNLEWYFGYHPMPLGGDLTAGDFRLREDTWVFMHHARRFMQEQLPFWRMQPADSLVSGENDAFGGAEVFAAEGEIYAVYLPSASGNQKLDLKNAGGSFSVQWFNPRDGKFAGDTRNVTGNQSLALGKPPSASNEDWVVLVKSHNAQGLPDFVPEPVAASQPEPVPVEPAVQVQPDPEPTNEPEPVTTAEPEPVLNEDPQQSGDSEATDTETNPPANQPPYFLDSGDLPEAVPGLTYKVSVVVVDPDGVAPVVTADVLPAGMRITDVQDGVVAVEWQVPADAKQVTSFELVAIDARDRDVSVRKTFNIPVQVVAEPAPEPVVPEQVVAEPEPEPAAPEQVVAEPAPVQAATEQPEPGQPETTANDPTPVVPPNSTDLPPFIYALTKAEAFVGQKLLLPVVPIDPEGIVASLRLAEKPLGSELKDNGDGSRIFTWTPTKSDQGIYILKFIATDAGQTPHVVQHELQLHVRMPGGDDPVGEVSKFEIPNYRPVFVPVEDMDVQAGQTVTFVVRPIDANGTPPILHVEAPPVDSSFKDNNDGSRTFEWTVPETQEGSVALTFTATDVQDMGIAVQMTTTLTVVPK